MKALRAAAAFLLAAGAFCPVAAHAAAHMLERAAATHEHEDGLLHRHDASEPHPELSDWSCDDAPRLSPEPTRLRAPRRAVVATAEPVAPAPRALARPARTCALDPPPRPPSSVVPPARAGRAPPR